MPDTAPATPFGLPLMASGGGRANIDAWYRHAMSSEAAKAAIKRLNLQYMNNDPSYGIFANIRQGASNASAGQGFGGSGRIAQLRARPGLISAGQSYMDALQNLSLGLQNSGFGYDQTRAQSAMNAVDQGVNNTSWSPAASRQAWRRIQDEMLKQKQ